jgi:hypothetical protein
MPFVLVVVARISSPHDQLVKGADTEFGNHIDRDRGLQV